MTLYKFSCIFRCDIVSLYLYFWGVFINPRYVILYHDIVTFFGIIEYNSQGDHCPCTTLYCEKVHILSCTFDIISKHQLFFFFVGISISGNYWDRWRHPRTHSSCIWTWTWVCKSQKTFTASISSLFVV